MFREISLSSGSDRNLKIERFSLTLALLEPSNNLRGSFSYVDPTCLIEIDVYRHAPFGRDIDAPLKTFVSPPIEPHKKIFIREYVAELNR
jgi:hypothetical protein